MDYANIFYRGRYVYSTKEYVSSFRPGFFYISYDPRERKKMLEEIESIIDFYSSVDLYAFAHLLYDTGDKYALSRAYSILDMIVSWNYIPAKYLLGQMYYFGAYVEQDYSKFFALSLEAANAGFVPAKNALAIAYFNGQGCAKDWNKGRKLLEECENAKYGVGYANLGVGYFKGLYGYPKDEYKAFEYFKLASGQFNVKGTYNLALMYLSGTGCKKDVEKGLYELMNAASLGHVKAQSKVGDYYYYGEITKKNLDRAYEFYLMAAENGDPHGMYSVGYMIIYNEKPFIDRYTGIDWLRKAANLGNESAKELLKKI